MDRSDSSAGGGAAAPAREVLLSRVRAKLLVGLVAFVDQRVLQPIAAVRYDLTYLFATEQRHKVVRMNSLQVRQISYTSRSSSAAKRRSPQPQIIALTNSSFPFPTYTFHDGMMEARWVWFCIVVYETWFMNDSKLSSPRT